MEGMEHLEGVPAHWLSYIYAEDVDATAAKAVELGGTLTAEPMDVPGVCRMAVVRDPQGATFGLFQPAGHPGMARHGLQPGGFSWFDLMTTDVEAAKAFYGGLFGWTAETNPMADGNEYTSWKRGEQGFGGMMQMEGEEWAGIPSHWLPYVTVSDVDAALAAASEHGGQVHVPATDIPEVGRFSMVADPGGAMLSIIAYAEAMTAGGEGGGEPAAATAS
jgi:predicted enzyme related to lactoylglutathione lyase